MWNYLYTKKSAKSICKECFLQTFFNFCCIFKVTKILKFVDVYRLLVSIYMFNILKLDMYLSMRASLNLSIPDHPYQTRNRHEFNLVFSRVESIRMSYKYQFVKVWNELSPDLKCKPTLRSFETALTQSFIDGY